MTPTLPEFDEDAAESQAEETFNFVIPNMPSLEEAFVVGARWQYAQSAAKIAAMEESVMWNRSTVKALENVIEQNERNIAAQDARIEWMSKTTVGECQSEITSLRAQLAEVNRKWELLDE